MVNLITEKTQQSSISVQNTTFNTPKIEQAKEAPPKENCKNKSLFFPFSLIAGGGILLYLGLKKPSKTKQIDEFVRNRCIQMDTKINRFVDFVKNSVDEAFRESSNHIQTFKNERHISPANSVIHINMLYEPNKILNAQDLAFEAIYSKDKELYKGGASYYDAFKGKITEITQRVSGTIDSEKNRISLKLTDYTYIPQFKDGSHEELLQSGGNQLISMRNSIVMQMESIKKGQLQSIQKRQLAGMADAIIQYRKLKTLTKEHILDTTFNKMRYLLKLGDDFVPLYDKTSYNLNEIANLQSVLTPQTLPKKIVKIYGDNLFINIAQDIDLSDLTPQVLGKLFNKISYDCNLKDLKYLIDRIRLRQAALNATKPNEAEKYGILIAKLEYLSNELHKFGREELIKRCQRDFSQMSYGQMKAALYQINIYSRRLGYESIELMDKDFAKNSLVYRELNIRNYMKIFKDYPELYFM
ncbi:hypothetical protein IJ541_03015 [bacterium]|nr:hypothetical protein [bacterium]